jgi:PAS domain S-box-containing protein
MPGKRAKPGKGRASPRRGGKAPSAPLPPGEEFLRVAFDTPLVGIVVVGADGKKVFANDCAVARTGYTRAEYLDLPMTAFGLPEEIPQDLEWLGRMAAGEIDHHSRVRRFVRKDGSTYWASMSVHCARAPGGSISHLYFFVTDLTELKEAETALKESEARYRDLVDLSPFAVVLYRNGRVELANRAALAMHGARSLEDVLGRPPLDFVHPDSAEWAAARMGELAGGERVPTVEARLLRLDGTSFEVEGSAISLVDHRGPAVQVVYRDVTDEKRAAEALRRNEAKLALASRLAAMGTLVAGVAHEINNPLVGVVASDGFAVEELLRIRERVLSGQAMDDGALAGEIDEVVAALADSRAASKRIADIVRDMSALSRPDPRLTRVVLRGVVEEAVAWLPAAVRESAHVGIEDIGAPDVMAASGQIQQVVINLVTNGVKAVPARKDGRVTVRIGPGRPGMARLEVADNGSGIAPGIIEQIFDPFFTTREVGQGMGLGLPICHAIVTAHGGTLTVESEPGKGSTFRVELPAAPA